MKHINAFMWLGDDLTRKYHTPLGYSMVVEDDNGVTVFFQPLTPDPPREKDYFLAYSYNTYLDGGGVAYHKDGPLNGFGERMPHGSGSDVNP